MEKQIVNPWNWQASQGWSWGIDTRGSERVLYCSGQVATDANGRVRHPRDMAAQVQDALDNLEHVLHHAGPSSLYGQTQTRRRLSIEPAPALSWRVVRRGDLRPTRVRARSHAQSGPRCGATLSRGRLARQRFGAFLANLPCSRPF